MKTESDEYAAIERWVMISQPEEVRQRLIGAQGSEKSDVEMAIMTFIAIGDRPELEAAFPEFAHANPVHTFGPSAAAPGA